MTVQELISMAIKEYFYFSTKNRRESFLNLVNEIIDIYFLGLEAGLEVRCYFCEKVYKHNPLDEMTLCASCNDKFLRLVNEKCGEAK